MAPVYSGEYRTGTTVCWQSSIKRSSSMELVAQQNSSGTRGGTLYTVVRLLWLNHLTSSGASISCDTTIGIGSKVSAYKSHWTQVGPMLRSAIRYICFSLSTCSVPTRGPFLLATQFTNHLIRLPGEQSQKVNMGHILI